MQVVMSWEEKAEQRGLQQGLQQGQQQGRLSVITHVIERRFGPIDAATRERISGLSSDQLDSLADALFDFNEVDDLIRWLDSL